MSIEATLHKYGQLGVQALKQAVQKVSATGDTADSIHYEVKSTEDTDTLRLLGRAYFKAIETGRGPREGSTDEGFKDNMLAYMKARGIGSDLDEKKRENLAKFLVYKINKEGDKTYKQGGRIVYTPALNKLVEELKRELTRDFQQQTIKEIRGLFKNSKKEAA